MTEQQIEQIKGSRNRLEERLLDLADKIASRDWSGGMNESMFLNQKSLHIEFLSVRDALRELERILESVH